MFPVRWSLYNTTKKILWKTLQNSRTLDERRCRCVIVAPKIANGPSFYTLFSHSRLPIRLVTGLSTRARAATANSGMFFVRVYIRSTIETLCQTNDETRTTRLPLPLVRLRRRRAYSRQGRLNAPQIESISNTIPPPAQYARPARSAQSLRAFSMSVFMLRRFGCSTRI